MTERPSWLAESSIAKKISMGSDAQELLGKVCSALLGFNRLPKNLRISIKERSVPQNISGIPSSIEINDTIIQEDKTYSISYKKSIFRLGDNEVGLREKLYVHKLTGQKHSSFSISTEDTIYGKFGSVACDYFDPNGIPKTYNVSDNQEAVQKTEDVIHSLLD